MGNPLNRYNLGLFNSGTYLPGINNIVSITQSSEALVTTSLDHNYVINQEVQFFIPPEWGMRQLDQLKGYILSIPSSTQFTVNINTTLFDAFVIPVVPSVVVINPAEVAGIGENNTGQTAPGGKLPLPQTIPGAFVNYRP